MGRCKHWKVSSFLSPSLPSSFFLSFLHLLFLLSFYLLRRRWHPTPVFLPGKSHGQRSLVGCSPWGCRESDRTEWFHFTFSKSLFFASGGQSIGASASASVLPMNIQAWFPLWRRKWQSTPVLLPGKFHGQRGLVGYSPWGRKDSDTTERLHFPL